MIGPHLEIIDDKIASSLECWHTIRFKSLAQGERSKVGNNSFFKQEALLEDSIKKRDQLIEEQVLHQLTKKKRSVIVIDD